MTNQEIYDELGQRGIVLISCIEMMSFDEENDDNEINVILKIADDITGNDEAKSNELLRRCLEVREEMETMERILDYIVAGSELFKGLDKATRIIYLNCLKAVANADGQITNDETDLYYAIFNIVQGK